MQQGQIVTTTELVMKDRLSIHQNKKHKSHSLRELEVMTTPAKQLMGNNISTKYVMKDKSHLKKGTEGTTASKILWWTIVN